MSAKVTGLMCNGCNRPTVAVRLWGEDWLCETCANDAARADSMGLTELREQHAAMAKFVRWVDQAEALADHCDMLDAMRSFGLLDHDAKLKDWIKEVT